MLFIHRFEKRIADREVISSLTCCCCWDLERGLIKIIIKKDNSVKNAIDFF